MNTKMSSFSGFSETDILNLQNGELHTSIHNSAQQNAVPFKKYPPTKVQQSSKADTRKKVVLENKLNTTQIIDVPDEAKFIQDKQVVSTTIHNEFTNAQNTQINDTAIMLSAAVPRTGITQKTYIDLNSFKQKQKLMEEQNRIRKEQVAKALAQRTKRTMQEQQKLIEIQDEFKTLDATLSNDVKLLRSQIESASYEYMEAQKRYHKMEKQYLEAKLYLQQKLDKKELLTEHLCAIIEKNEERKADKLNELLQKLDVLEVDNSQADTAVSNE